MAGTNVCIRMAVFAPHLLTAHPATKRFTVPGPQDSVSDRKSCRMRRREGGRQGFALTTECRCYTEDAKLRGGAGRNLVARASVAVAGIRRVVVVEGVARHEPKDVEQAMSTPSVYENKGWEKSWRLQTYGT